MFSRRVFRFKWVGPAFCMATALALAAVWASAREGNGGVPGQQLRGQTSLGTPVPWPHGFDVASLASGPKYSPGGLYLAQTTNTGRLIILDLATTAASDFYELSHDARPNLGCTMFAWLSDARLLLVEHWASDEEIRSFDPQSHGVLGQWMHRVVQWQTGEVVLERSFGYAVPPISVVGVLSEREWAVRRTSEPGWKSRVWLYDADSGACQRVLYESAEGEDSSYFGMRGTWLPVLHVPPDEGVNPFGQSIELEYVDLTTGQRRAVHSIPPVAGWGPIVTRDARYEISSRFDLEGYCWRPLIIDTESGQRTELPASELWKPAAISEARGVLAVDVTRAVGEDFSTEWFEIPLTAILPR